MLSGAADSLSMFIHHLPRASVGTGHELISADAGRLHGSIDAPVDAFTILVSLEYAEACHRPDSENDEEHEEEEYTKQTACTIEGTHVDFPIM